MKLLVILILIVAAIGGWLYFDTQTRRNLLKDTPLAPAANLTTVYKWRDEYGNWQITDKPPPAGTEFERLQYHNDTNVMPLVPRDKED